MDDLTEEQIECVDLNELWNPKLFTENSLGSPKSKVWKETWKDPETGKTKPFGCDDTAVQNCLISHHQLIKSLPWE